MKPISRREALISGAAAFLTTPVLPVTRSHRRQTSPAMNKLGLALIGCGGMGSHNLRQSLADPDTELIAVCDVQKHRTDAWLKTHPGAKAYNDYREVLRNPQVDAVIIATPPHWHCLQAIEAAEAGKHIYLQKPMTIYPAETLAVRNAIRRHKVVTQVGTQIHQAANYRRVVDWVRSGRLGKIGRVEMFWGWNMGVGGIGTAPKEDPPDDIDFDLWLGPAEECEFNRLLVADAALHCSWMAYSGGWTPGMAPHLLDLPVWALELGYPEKTTCIGGRYILGGDGDAPDTQDVVWQYPDLTMRWHFAQFNHHGYEFGSKVRALGIYFHGSNGTLRTDYNTHEIIPQSDALDPNDVPEQVVPDGGIHEIEWLDCIRNGGEPSCNVEYHSKVDLPITLATLSHLTGHTADFSAELDNMAEAKVFANRGVPQYRAPWRFPTRYFPG